MERKFSEVAVIRRLHRGEIEVLRVGNDDVPGAGTISALIIFANVTVADEYVAESEGLGLANGWRAQMVDACDLAFVLEAFGVEYIALPTEPGLGGDTYVGLATEFVEALR